MSTRIDLIICHPKFREYIEKNKQEEVHREFCKHDLQHSLDVARIMYIIKMEQELTFEKDILYATAMLHDIGRWEEYFLKTPHSVASARYAEQILSQCDFKREEIDIIVEAITTHSNEDNLRQSLSQLLYIADKESRQCFNCQAYTKCNWAEQTKNNTLKY